jgi:hypothetical protein
VKRFSVRHAPNREDVKRLRAPFRARAAGVATPERAFAV